MTLAQGEWICFVDSDDTLPVDSLEKLDAGICDATDIVIGFCDNQKILTKNGLISWNIVRCALREKAFILVRGLD